MGDSYIARSGSAKLNREIWSARDSGNARAHKISFLRTGRRNRRSSYALSPPGSRPRSSPPSKGLEPGHHALQ